MRDRKFGGKSKSVHKFNEHPVVRSISFSILCESTIHYMWTILSLPLLLPLRGWVMDGEKKVESLVLFKFEPKNSDIGEKNSFGLRLPPQQSRF